MQTGELQQGAALDVHSDIQCEAELFDESKDSGMLGLSRHLLGGGTLVVAGLLNVLPALSFSAGYCGRAFSLIGCTGHGARHSRRLASPTEEESQT